MNYEHAKCEGCNRIGCDTQLLIPQAGRPDIYVRLCYRCDESFEAACYKLIEVGHQVRAKEVRGILDSL